MSTATARKTTYGIPPRVKTETSVKPTPAQATFWTRVATQVRRVVAVIAKPVLAIVRRVRLVAHKIVSGVRPVIKRAWTRALRPFLKGVFAGVATFTFVVAAVVAPLTTALLALGMGLFFLGLAWVVKRLERREFSSRAAAIALAVLDGIGVALKVIAYATAAAIAAVMAMTSWPFAVFAVALLVMGYFDVRGAGTISFLLWSALSGNWALGLAWLLWRGASALTAPPLSRDIPEESEIRREPLIHVDVLRRSRDEHVATGAEEMADVIIEAETVAWATSFDNTVACAACGTDKGALRVRSNAPPFVTTGAFAGTPHEVSSDTLCGDCYDAECEDNALAMTGVSLRKRSVDVVLNALGRQTLPEVAASMQDPTTLHWAVVAWWRDRRNQHHERQWDCYHAGQVVASVIYDHPRRAFRASVLGKLVGTKSSLAVAKRLASDVVSDEGLATVRLVDALQNAMPAQAGP